MYVHFMRTCKLHFKNLRLDLSLDLRWQVTFIMVCGEGKRWEGTLYQERGFGQEENIRLAKFCRGLARDFKPMVAMVFDEKKNRKWSGLGHRGRMRHCVDKTGGQGENYLFVNVGFFLSPHAVVGRDETKKQEIIIMHCICHLLIQSSKRFTIIITQTDHMFCCTMNYTSKQDTL